MRDTAPASRSPWTRAALLEATGHEPEVATRMDRIHGPAGSPRTLDSLD